MRILKKVLVNKFDISLLYCVSFPGFTCKCGIKYTGTNLQTFQDEETISLLEKKFQGGFSTVLGDRYVKPDEIKKIFYLDTSQLHAWSMGKSLAYDVNKFARNGKLEDN